MRQRQMGNKATHGSEKLNSQQGRAYSFSHILFLTQKMDVKQVTPFIKNAQVYVKIVS